MVIKMPPKKKSKMDSHHVTTKEEISSSEESDKAVKSKRGKKITSQDDTDKKPLQSKTNTEFHTQDFNNTSTTTDGKIWNLKIASWNVDGLRAWIKVFTQKTLANLDNESSFTLFTERRIGVFEA